MEVSVNKYAVLDQDGNVIRDNKFIKTEPKIPVTPTNYVPGYVLGRALYNYIINEILNEEVKSSKVIMNSITTNENTEGINLQLYAIEIYNSKKLYHSEASCIVDVLVYDLMSLIKRNIVNPNITYSQLRTKLYTYFKLQ